MLAINERRFQPALVYLGDDRREFHDRVAIAEFDREHPLLELRHRVGRRNPFLQPFSDIRVYADPRTASLERARQRFWVADERYVHTELVRELLSSRKRLRAALDRDRLYADAFHKLELPAAQSLRPR